jgi:sulfonate transport system permease protein
MHPPGPEHAIDCPGTHAFVLASGTLVSGTLASGKLASGKLASGKLASGKLASGKLASGGAGDAQLHGPKPLPSLLQT